MMRAEKAMKGRIMLAGKHILLIIGGGIAAFKSLDLIRRLRDRGAEVTPVLTRAGRSLSHRCPSQPLPGTRFIVICLIWAMRLRWVIFS